MPAAGRPLRLAVLTTDTLHHRYFLHRLDSDLPEGFEIAQIVFEERPYPWWRNRRRHFIRTLPNLVSGVVFNPYFQPRSAARLQDAFEAPRFFPNGLPKGRLSDRAIRCHSANDTAVVRLLENDPPDVIFVYGTGKLAPQVFRTARAVALNAHGGRLPTYRGLDTNLWAALAGRPGDMCVTIHELEAELDTGAVMIERAIPPAREMSIHSLRYFTTLVCVDCALEALSQVAAGAMRLHRNDGPSRYYGPMPWLLKRRADRFLRSWATSQCEAG